MNDRIEPMIQRSPMAGRTRAAVVGLLVVVLAGCGGGGGGDDAPAAQAPTASSTAASGGGSLIGVLYCVLGGFLYGLCPDTSGSDTPSSTVADDCVDYYCSGAPGVSYPVGFYETGPQSTPNSLDIEPNNELATAAQAPIGVLNDELGLLGFETNGTLDGLNDGTDTYIFTAPRALQLGLQLCEASGALCDAMTPESSLDVDFAHIVLRDQDGNIVASTVNDADNGNLISVAIDGGVPYYVSIVSGYKTFNLLPKSKHYYLRVIGAEPLPDTPPAEPELATPSAPELFNAGGGNLWANIAWFAPTLNTDGTALAGIQGYVLYVGNQAGGPYSYSMPLDVGLSTYVFSLPDYGTWYAALTVIDTNGVESGFSNEIEFTEASPYAP